jgi:hypothetical protein
MLIEGHIGCARYLGAVIRGNKLCMEAPGYFNQPLHDALYVDDHGIDGAGDNCQFLLKVISCDGHPVPHHHFIGCAAHPAKLMPFAL